MGMAYIVSSIKYALFRRKEARAILAGNPTVAMENMSPGELAALRADPDREAQNREAQHHPEAVLV